MVLDELLDARPDIVWRARDSDIQGPNLGEPPHPAAEVPPRLPGQLLQEGVPVGGERSAHERLPFRTDPVARSAENPAREGRGVGVGGEVPQVPTPKLPPG